MLSAAALALAACNPTIEGNGIRYEDPRAVDPFTGIEIEDGIDAVVTAGDPQSVTVITDANIVTGVETEVRNEPSHGQVLRVWISFSNDIKPTIPPSVTIYVPDLDFVSVKDGASARVGRAQAETMTIRGEGDGLVVLNGVGGALLDARLASATLDAWAYPVSGGAYVELSGNAQATLNVDGDVTGFVHDTSRIDNTRGTGTCAVERDAGATVACHPPP